MAIHETSGANDFGPSRPGARMGLATVTAVSALVAAAAPPAQPAADDASRDGADQSVIVFAGDTAFGERYQQDRALRGHEHVLRARGYDHPAQRVAPLLSGADLAVVNLETSLNRIAASPLSDRKQILHQGAPRATVEALRRLGVDAVSLANNHAFDYGREGLRQTALTLDVLHVARFGAGMDAAEAAAPLVVDLPLGPGAVRLVVLGGFEVRPRDAALGYYAGVDEPGVNGWTAQTAAAQARAARAEHPHALIVAFPHWGENYQWRTDSQRAIAHALVDAGVDLVLGHGAHLAQELEVYADRWIVYSLGNFVFLSNGRYGDMGEKVLPVSLVARLSVQAARRGDVGARPAVSLRLTPILSDNLETDFQPRPLTPERADAVRRTLLERSGAAPALARRLRLDAAQTPSSLVVDLRPREHSLRLRKPAPGRP